MTIEEATILVLEASSFSKGGELFLLDMGKPVKILDLAKNMIKLNGKVIKGTSKNNEAIEIIFTGLRKGEKLYEELLINDQSEKTEHSRIFKEVDKYSIEESFDLELENLCVELDKHNKKETIRILSKMVPEWKIGDHLF